MTKAISYARNKHMADIEDDTLANEASQNRFFHEASRLTARDLDYLIANPDRYATRDPDNPLLARPTGQTVNRFGTASAEAYRIFDGYLSAWGARNDVATLYRLLLATKARTGKMNEVADRVKALEYAIWDGKYRFEELALKFIETSASHKFVCRNSKFEAWRRHLRKEIGRFFRLVEGIEGLIRIKKVFVSRLIRICLNCKCTFVWDLIDQN